MTRCGFCQAATTYALCLDCLPLLTPEERNNVFLAQAEMIAHDINEAEMRTKWGEILDEARRRMQP